MTDDYRKRKENVVPPDREFCPHLARAEAAERQRDEARAEAERLREALRDIRGLCDGIKLGLADDVGRMCRAALSEPPEPRTREKVEKWLTQGESPTGVLAWDREPPEPRGEGCEHPELRCVACGVPAVIQVPGRRLVARVDFGAEPKGEKP